MSLNKFMGIGNLTRNAEVRQVGQSTVARFGLAMSEKFKKQDGTLGENTEFLDIDLWGQPGVHPYLVKGQMVYVEGSIRTEKWNDQQGQPHSATRVRAHMVQLLGSRPQAAAPAPQPAAPQYQQAHAPQQYAHQAPAPQYQQAPPAPQPQAPAPPQYQQAAQPAPAPSPYPQYAPQAPVDDLPPAGGFDPDLGF